MHYPLHITVLCTALWILQNDVNAAKTGINAEVLTSFARNVASILSSTLLSDFQDAFSNQSVNYLGSLKKRQETQSLSIEKDTTKNSEIPTKAYFDRFKRFTGQDRSSKKARRGFQDAYLTNDAKYSKRENHEFFVNPEERISEDRINLEAIESISSDTRENSIDSNAASLHYFNHYHHPPDFKYKPELIRSLDNPNHHSHFGLHSHYNLHQAPAPTQPIDVGGIETNAVGNENIQARLTPVQYNYHNPLHHHPLLYRHPGFIHPHGGPFQGNGQPAAPASEQDEDNPSGLIEDQSQGQSALAGYDYSPRFHYRSPYFDGFFGPPDFYHGPFNASFNPGSIEQPGGNSTNGQFPHGPYPFHGYGFHPRVPFHQPYYPGFPGHRPVQPQTLAENSGAPDQASPENGQGNGNSTMDRHPYGFPPHGPFYGGFHPPGYPLAPFHGLPYHRFNHVFHDHFVPRFRAIPYFHLHGDPYLHLPLHWYPFGGFYPNHYAHRPTMPENPKPAQTERTAGETSETSESPMNSDAEVISESRSGITRSLPSNRREKLLVPWPLVKESDKLTRELAFNQLS